MTNENKIKEIIINNKYLKNQKVIYFSMLNGKVKIVFEYDYDFAKKHGLYFDFYNDASNYFEIKYTFGGGIWQCRPIFNVRIDVDIENNKIFIN